ncbi:MAG: hypothetical protein WDW36_004944 [Sanguina aurantia]
MAVSHGSEHICSLLTGLGDPKHLQRERSATKLVTALASAVQQNLLDGCMQLLEDPEVRVRLAVGELLRALAVADGSSRVWDETHGRIMDSIRLHFDRDGEGSRAGSTAPSTTSSPAMSRSNSANDLIGALLENSYRVQKPGSGELRHGTEGWRCLETSMRALQQLIDGCGPQLAPQLRSPEVLELLFESLRHPNRFVREAGHMSMRTACAALKGESLDALVEQIAERLADGLSDNWSQVRLTACVSTRALMEHLGEEAKDRALRLLIGPMCLNRYYVAEGVKRYAQETWVTVLGQGGRGAIARHIDAVVSHYISQTKAVNFTVREAACACIAELAEKVDRSVVGPRVAQLTRALLQAFKDMSWPVRDAACSACGRCVIAYPAELLPVRDEMFELWVAHLWDNIPSVRETTARALAAAVSAYGADATARLLPALRTLLPKAREQPPEAQRLGGGSSGGGGGGSSAGPGEGVRGVVDGGVLPVAAATASGGAATAGGDGSSSGGSSGGGAGGRRRSKKAGEDETAAHTDQDMFSCNTMLSRFGNAYAIKGDGCMDYGFPRDREPWEASDGALFMLRELSSAAPHLVAQFLPEASELSRLACAPVAFGKMRATLWAALAVVAPRLGKRVFKPFLDPFLDALFLDLAHGSDLTACAAGHCAAVFRDLLGPAILAGRCTPEHSEAEGEAAAKQKQWRSSCQAAAKQRRSSGEAAAKQRRSSGEAAAKQRRSVQQLCTASEFTGQGGACPAVCYAPAAGGRRGSGGVRRHVADKAAAAECVGQRRGGGVGSSPGGCRLPLNAAPQELRWCAADCLPIDVRHGGAT